MAKKPMLLSDFFHETLKDIYFAENKILKTLPDSNTKHPRVDISMSRVVLSRQPH